MNNNSPFLNEGNFFKSHSMDQERGILLKAAHKYIKRTGTKGNYKYFYMTPEGKVVQGPSPSDKKKTAKMEYKVGDEVEVNGRIGEIKSLGRNVQKVSGFPATIEHTVKFGDGSMVTVDREDMKPVEKKESSMDKMKDENVYLNAKQKEAFNELKAEHKGKTWVGGTDEVDGEKVHIVGIGDRKFGIMEDGGIYSYGKGDKKDSDKNISDLRNKRADVVDELSKMKVNINGWSLSHDESTGALTWKKGNEIINATPFWEDKKEIAIEHYNNKGDALSKPTSRVFPDAYDTKGTVKLYLDAMKQILKGK